MDTVVSVAKRCKIHDKIVQMENGYQTRVGELGNQLSGGEKQRILIARGLLKEEP